MRRTADPFPGGSIPSLGSSHLVQCPQLFAIAHLPAGMGEPGGAEKLHDYVAEIQWRRGRIQKDGDLSKDQREWILRFVDAHRGEVSPARIATYLRNLPQVAQRMDKYFLDPQKDAEQVFKARYRTKDKGRGTYEWWTVATAASCIMKFW